MINKNNKFIRPSTWIIIGIAVIFIIGVFGYQMYNKFQQRKIETEKKFSEQQKNEKLLLQNQLDQQALDAELQNTTLNELKQQITDLKNKQPEANTESKTIVINGANYTKIVTEWQNRVAEVVCFFGEVDITKGTVPEVSGGSSLLANIEGYGLVAITNRHVITNNSGKIANYCVVGFYGGGFRVASVNSVGGDPFLIDTRGKDSALIMLDDKFLTDKGETKNQFFSSPNNNSLRICPKERVSLGDQIIVLGYPSIGSEESITVTAGIISGLETDYYVTDAKIDHGNSGGAAILLKYSCYLGIPTWVNPGSFESLGRILIMDF